jgi:hypothetical protein
MRVVIEAARVGMQHADRRTAFQVFVVLAEGADVGTRARPDPCTVKVTRKFWTRRDWASGVRHHCVQLASIFGAKAWYADILGEGNHLTTPQA